MKPSSRRPTTRFYLTRSTWRWYSPTKMSTQMTTKSTICLFILYLFAVGGVQAETMGQTAIQATADSGNKWDLSITTPWHSVNPFPASFAASTAAKGLTTWSFYASLTVTSSPTPTPTPVPPLSDLPLLLRLRLPLLLLL